MKKVRVNPTNDAPHLTPRGFFFGGKAFLSTELIHQTISMFYHAHTIVDWALRLRSQVTKITTNTTSFLDPSTRNILQWYGQLGIGNFSHTSKDT